MDIEKIKADIWRTQRLLMRLGHTTPLAATHLDPPEPDVAVETPDGVIGVELTELNPKGQLRRKHEEEEEQVTQAAGDLYDAARLPTLDVKVCWSGLWAEGTMTRANRPRRAKELADFVARHIPAEGSSAFLDGEEQPDIGFPEGVHYVSVVRLPGTPSFWGCPRVDWSPEVTVEDIDRAMARKNRKVRHYRGDYREVWLLLVTGASGPATWGKITESLLSARFPSRFNRSFVLGLTDGGFLELKVDRLPEERGL